MEPEPEPWEALDLDDSDLPSLLRPCKRKRKRKPQTPLDIQPLSLLSQPIIPIPNPNPNSPPPSSPILIPGPAGAVQAAMLRKLQNRNNPLHIDEEPLSTQECIRKAVEDPGADDDDFSRDPWLFALNFIRRQGLADNGGTIGTPLSCIKTEPKIGNRKVAQVVAIIKSCKPNGLGDLMVTLKDPTGAIDASIHRKVLVEGDFGKDISVGTVLILQKAISKDSQPLSQQSITSMVTPPVHGFENSKQPWKQQKLSSLSLERNDAIMNSFRRTGYMRGSVHNGNIGDEVLGSSCCIEERNTSQNGFAGKEPMVRQDTVSGLKKATAVTGTNDQEENVVLEKQLSPQNLGGGDHNLESNQSSGGANLFGVAVNQGQEQEKITRNGDTKQRQVSKISRVSLPQWTDEQLDELCSFE